MVRLFAVAAGIALTTTLAQPARALPKPWQRLTIELATESIFNPTIKNASTIEWLGRQFRFPGEKILDYKALDSKNVMIVVTDKAIRRIRSDGKVFEIIKNIDEVICAKILDKEGNVVAFGTPNGVTLNQRIENGNAVKATTTEPKGPKIEGSCKVGNATTPEEDEETPGVTIMPFDLDLNLGSDYPTAIGVELIELSK